MDRQVLKGFVVLLVAAAAVILLLTQLRRWENSQQTVNVPTSESDRQSADANLSDEENEELTYYNGAWYSRKDHLETVLLMGLDKYEENQYLDGYTNTQQSDFLLLLVFDQDSETCSAVQINRDTMTDITILGLNGKKAGSMTGQLALAHTYGSGREDSCLNTVEAVSNLLYGVEVDHYIAVTMDAVPILNDQIGGVTLTVMDDFSAVDPDLIQGEKVTLQGEQALTYVRTRMGLEDSTNLHRMQRQQQYMIAFREQFEQCIQKTPEIFAETLLGISPYMVSDCTISQLSELYENTEVYGFSDILTLEGETVKEGEYMAFYPDNDALRSMVIKLFYEWKE